MFDGGSKARPLILAVLLALALLAGCAEENASLYAPDTTPPAVSSLAESEGTVAWTTNEASTCVLLYGDQQGIYDHYGYNVTDGGTSHHVDLIDVPAEKFYFRVVATDLAGNAAASSETSFTLTVVPSPDKFVYTMVDVGWGDCHFLQFPGGTTVMIDSGMEEHGLDVSGFLQASHIDGPGGITYMIGTHAHSDHLGGFPGLVVLYRDAAFLAPESSSVNVFQYLNEDLTRAHMQRHGLRNGQTDETAEFLDWDPAHGVKVKVLSAGAGRLFSAANTSDSINCDSAVLKVSYGQVDFLLTGDAEEFDEDLMIKEHRDDLACEVLKVGHHGNDDATSELFLKCVRARVGLISNSLAENDGVFKQSVINLLRSYNVDYYVTDRTYMNAARNAAPQHGNVTVTTDGETFVVGSWK